MITAWTAEAKHWPAEGEWVVGAWPEPGGGTHVAKVVRKGEKWLTADGNATAPPICWTHLPKFT